ncbi:MAG TPA: hypothetical protein VGE11_23935 [Pseudonocardia sp.]
MGRAVPLRGSPGHCPYEVAEWATSLTTDQLGFQVDGTTDPGVSP